MMGWSWDIEWEEWEEWEESDKGEGRRKMEERKKIHSDLGM